MPRHENVIKNFVNVELFHKKDKKQKDCLGWITIMEKADENLRRILKEEKLGVEERKKIVEGIANGHYYLKMVGIQHFDLKMENILIMNGVPKIIDFGLVTDETGRSGYREMGYARRGSKFRTFLALRKFIDIISFTYFSCWNTGIRSTPSVIWIWLSRSQPLLFFVVRLENVVDTSL